MKDFMLIKIILQNHEIREQLKLSGEVVVYNNRVENKDDRVKKVTTNLKDIK